MFGTSFPTLFRAASETTKKSRCPREGATAYRCQFQSADIAQPNRGAESANGRLVPIARTSYTFRHQGRFSDSRSTAGPFPSTTWTVGRLPVGFAENAFRQRTHTAARPSRIFTVFPFFVFSRHRRRPNLMPMYLLGKRTGHRVAGGGANGNKKILRSAKTAGF